MGDYKPWASPYYSAAGVGGLGVGGLGMAGTMTAMGGLSPMGFNLARQSMTPPAGISPSLPIAGNFSYLLTAPASPGIAVSVGLAAAWVRFLRHATVTHFVICQI